MTIKDVPSEFVAIYNNLDEDGKMLIAYMGYLQARKYINSLYEALNGMRLLKDDSGKENDK